jgi:hypothetical protein
MNLSSEEKQYKTATYMIGLLLWLVIDVIAIWQLIRLIGYVIRRPEIFLFHLVIYVCVIAYTLPYMFNLINKERLILLKDGIKHQSMFFSLYAKWENVKAIENRSFGQKKLILEEANFDKTKNRWLRWDPSFIRLGNSRNFIPLGSAYWESYKDLEAELKKRVPHLVV